MTDQFFAEDENVKAMRHTAREVGLIDLLQRAHQAQTIEEKDAFIAAALARLGVDVAEEGDLYIAIPLEDQ
jgi:hypothetical protein